MKKLLALVLSLCLLLTTLPSAMWAASGDEGTTESAPLELRITSLTAPTEVYQGGDTGYISFSFEVQTIKAGQALKAGQKVSVETNIGTLFDSDWDAESHQMQVKDSNGDVLGFFIITADKVTFTVEEAGAGQTAISGNVVSKSVLTAKDVGATQDQDVTKTLTVGEKSANIVFKWQQITPPIGDGGAVDINTFWKNAWENADHTGATVCLEVNPIESMHLYGSTTYKGDEDRSVKVHDQLFIKDEIPAHGFIDTSSMQIYAAVPVVAQADEEKNFNGYIVPAGVYYAQRSGTGRYFLNNDMHDKNCMMELEQEDNETLAEFEARIKAKSLSWGIYRDSSDEGTTETFMCNFGRVGDPKNNNGVMYSDFVANNYGTDYPDIFGEDGKTGGNVVSYYIEFATYYPDVVGSQELVNYASWSATGEEGWGNWSGKYLINNGSGTGVARANELIVKLIDEESKTPLEGATFAIEEQNDDGTWTETGQTAITDENGRCVFKYFPAGTYRVVQQSYLEDYEPRSSFTASGNDKVNNLNSDGEFTVNGDEAFGFGTVVTNKKIEKCTVTFDRNDESTDSTYKTVSLNKGTSVGNDWPENPTRDGYTFAGWNTKEDGSGSGFTEDTIVDGNMMVYAQWEKENIETVTITPETQTKYVGGTDGSGSGNSFPHPIYLLNGTALDADDVVEVNGEAWNDATNDYPFTVKYYQNDGTTELTSDETYGDFIVRIEPVDGVEVEDITINDHPITFDEGVLRIRYVSSNTAASENALTSPAVTYKANDDSAKAAARAQVEESGEAGVVLPEDTTIHLNGNDAYPYPAWSADNPYQIALLFDDLLPRTGGTSQDYADTLLAHADDQGIDVDGKDSQFQYLDLVDVNDANAWVSSSEGCDVFWPYPAGVNKNDDIQLLHFKGLHREYSMEGEANLATQIANSQVEVVKDIEKTDAGIWLYVDHNGFSPFALVWEEDHSWWPDWSGGGSDDNDEPDNPPALNTEDHFSYVVGYEDGLVKPQNNITRAEVASIFYRLLKEDVRDENTTTVSEFSDVSADDWYGTTVATLSAMNIVKGYEDGTFRPNASITRAEFAAIATRFFEETGAEYIPGTFTDVTGDEWFAGAIADGVNLGLIGGYEDGSVRPNNAITRAEACAIVNRTLGRVPDADHLLPEDVMKTWPDNPETAWYYADMQEATNGHEYEWITEDGNKVEEWTEIMLDNDWTERSVK